MKLSKVVKYSLGLASVSILSTLATSVFISSSLADPPSCESVAGGGTPPKNTVCSRRLTVKTAHADWPNGREINSNDFSVPSGWVITYVGNLAEISQSQGSASIKTVTSGEVSDVKTHLEQYYESLDKAYNKISSEATIPVDGVPVDFKGMLESIKDEMTRVKSSIDYASSAKSNIDKVILTANAHGECKASTFGKCLDGTGGWYEGYVDVYQVYIGTSGDIDTAKANTEKKVTNFLASIQPQKQQPVVACSSTYDPRPYRPGTSGWTGRVGPIAFNNGTSNSVQVTLYHPDAPDRAFNSWNVQPGQNLFLGGDNYGMDWGIQVDSSPICIVGSVSDWKSYNGGQGFQTWVERIRR